MKLHYYPDTDSLYIELKNTPGAEAREIVEGLVADFDADGNLVGLDIDHASRKLIFRRSRLSRCRPPVRPSESASYAALVRRSPPLPSRLSR